VTGQIHDIGQNVLQSYFQTGSSSSSRYFHIFFLIASLEEAFIRDIIILLCNLYIITVRTNDNSVVVNNNYGRIRDLILLFKIRMGTRNNFFEVYRQLGHAPSKWVASPALKEMEMKT
jgi:hypothetical protein